MYCIGLKPIVLQSSENNDFGYRKLQITNKI